MTRPWDVVRRRRATRQFLDGEPSTGPIELAGSWELDMLVLGATRKEMDALYRRIHDLARSEMGMHVVVGYTVARGADQERRAGHLARWQAGKQRPA